MAGTIRKTSFIRRSLPEILLAAVLAVFGGACARPNGNQSAKETGDLQTRKGPVRTPPDAGNRSRPLRIAAIVATFFPNSHAGVIVDKFLQGARRPTGTRPMGASVGDWIVHEPGATPAAEPIPISRDGTVRRPRPTN